MAEELKCGALLRHDTYRIERMLGQGGFGITYLARDLTLDRLVAVKEFFLKDYCEREETTSRVSIGTRSARELFSRYKEKFLKEARNIAKLNHPGIIRIHAAFEENDTAYYVMEYIEGMSLGGMVEQRGPLSVEKALEYIRGVGSALEYVHGRRINHLDIKPANIMVRSADDTPILIDFGLSKQYDSAGQQTSTTPTGLSHGYAPIEQYIAGGVSQFAPQTDLYSLAATLYFLLSGECPPQAHQLVQEELRFPGSIPERLRTAISAAMSPNIHDRQPDVAAFLASLTAPAPTPHPRPVNDDTLIGGSAEAEEEVLVAEVVGSPGTHPVSPAAPPASPPPPSRQERPSPAGRKGPALGVGETKKPKSKLYMWGGAALAAAVFIVLLIAFLPKGEKENVVPEREGLYYDDATSELVYGTDRYKMVYVPGGSFNMGSDDSDAFNDEKPVHRESVSGFYMGRTEVPQWLWVAVMGSNPSYWKGDNLPVEQVSWDDCQDFLRKLNSITGKQFRLPTEAEWEYAARGGNQSRGYKYSGSNDIGSVAWYTDNSGSQTHAVGTKAPNELGIYDMSGNVWEWTSDYWSSNYNSPRTSSSFVCRGGSWGYAASYCRVSYRIFYDSTDRDNHLGFRLAL